jgi:hypothetical protein
MTQRDAGSGYGVGHVPGWATARAGEGIGAVGDALIAGLAVELDATVVTRNVRDFSSQGVPTQAY